MMGRNTKRSKDRLVPRQRTGKAIDATGSLVLKDEDEAKVFFNVVKHRLQNVNGWGNLAGNLSATFQLTNPDGMPVSRDVQQGDYFKIDIPGPGSVAGNGFDWVQVENVENKSTQDGETFSFRVRPTEQPWKKSVEASEDIAHFYSQESTSTFTVSRNGRRVDAAIRDRNTKPNVAANSPAGKIRDVVVGTMGVISFSKVQWKSLIDGLLSR